MDGPLEAYRNQQIRPVPMKTMTQQVIGTLHRLPSGWLGDRTRAINSLRGLLRELGYFIPEGRKHVIRDNYFCRVATIRFAGFGRPDGA